MFKLLFIFLLLWSYYADKEVACSKNKPDSRLDCTNLTIYGQERLKTVLFCVKLPYTYTVQKRVPLQRDFSP